MQSINKWLDGKIKICANLLVLLVLVVALDIGVGLIIKPIFYKQKSGKYFLTTYALNICREDVLIFGNSHAANHYMPDIISSKLGCSCFNLGNQGQSIFFQHAILKGILKRYRPKIIILNIDNTELNSNRQDNQALSILLPYYWDFPEVRPFVEIKDTFEKIKAYSSCYRYNSTIGYILIYSFLKKKGNNIKTLGFDPLEGSLEKGTRKPEIHERPIKETDSLIDQAKKMHLKEFIEEIKKNDIKLYIIEAPLPNKSNQYSSDRNIEQLAYRYKVQYWNFSQDTAFLEKYQLFHDETHLNITGARIFSGIVASRIDKDVNEQKYR